MVLLVYNADIASALSDVVTSPCMWAGETFTIFNIKVVNRRTPYDLIL